MLIGLGNGGFEIEFLNSKIATAQGRRPAVEVRVESARRSKTIVTFSLTRFDVYRSAS